MNDKFENQKEKLFAIKHEVSLLYQQVNYLLRNEKPLELLDLDVLMNRTHTVYDLLCAININDDGLDEDLPFDAETVSGWFGGMVKDDVEDELEHDMEMPDKEQEEASVVDETISAEATTVEPQTEPWTEKQEETKVEEHLPEESREELHLVEVCDDVETAPDVPIEVQNGEKQETDNEDVKPSEPQSCPLPQGDDFGYFFRFEDVSEDEKPDTEIEEEEGKLIHFMDKIPEDQIPEKDLVGEDLVKDDPFQMPKMDEDSSISEELLQEKQNSESVSGFFANVETEFEMTPPETLGEKMMQEDHSLAAKLQQSSVHDLKSVIGISDKFLFVNELFGGSMEKYNKSIENLNDLKTLNGAMIYLNELKIELQWNSSNEAYQKLRDLVSRKFE